MNPLVKALIAALLSLLFAGLGHLYLERYPRAFLLIGLGALLYVGAAFFPPATLINLGLFIFSAFDAFSFGCHGHGIL